MSLNGEPLSVLMDRRALRSPARRRPSHAPLFDDAGGSRAGSDTFYFDVATATLYDRRTGAVVDTMNQYDPEQESPSLRRRRMRDGAPQGRITRRRSRSHYARPHRHPWSNATV